MAGTFNFQSLPKEMDSNLVKPGMNRLIIKAAKKEVATTGSMMLVVDNIVKGHDKVKITDRYVLFDSEGEPVTFGQYKLRRLLEATDTIPEGDFTIEVIARMLANKEYMAELIEEEYNGKIYLNVGSVDKFQKIETESLTSSTSSTTATTVITTQQLTTPTKLETDDDLV
jgi:hypothetical protein